MCLELHKIVTQTQIYPVGTTHVSDFNQYLYFIWTTHNYEFKAYLHI